VPTNGAKKNGVGVTERTGNINNAKARQDPSELRIRQAGGQKKVEKGGKG